MNKAPSSRQPVKPQTIDLDTGKAISGPAPDKIAAINALHRKAQSVASEAKAKTEEAAHLAILVGLRLRALRKTVPHGGWEKLFSSAGRRLANKGASSNAQHVAHFEFSESTARNYIAAAEGVIEARLTRKKALALEGLANKDTITEVDKKLLNEASRGETLRQLYLDLGIIKPTQAETIDRNRNTKGGPTKAQQAAKTNPESKEAFLNREALESAALIIDSIDTFEREGRGLRLPRKTLDTLRARVRDFAASLDSINA